MKDAIAKEVELLSVAMMNADKAALERVAAAELSYGHSNGKIQTKEEFVAAIVDGFSGFENIKLLDQVITVQGDTAVVRHIFTADTYGKGKEPAKVRIGNVLTFTKIGNEWKLLARQAYKLP